MSEKASLEDEVSFCQDGVERRRKQKWNDDKQEKWEEVIRKDG